jgi:diguanylate cyclase (GGDEF)-like protein
MNFRDYGLKSAEDKAKLTAEIVKSGLTAHMVNGMMDQRDYFLKQISDVENINELWIARGSTVIKQYGQGHNNEIPRDKIDKEVLKNGITISDVTETPTRSLMRVTIPYVASSYGSPNCTSCHEAKEGEVLGVISMVMDITGVRTSSLKTILFNMLLTILVIIFVFIVINRFIKPYVNIFYSIQDVMNNAYRGDYTARVESGNGHPESKQVANLLNTMLEKLQHTFEELDKKVYVFIKNKNYVKESDPLKNINITIERLSDIYKFKQTIENDKELQDIYNRIAYVLEHHFSLDDFTIIEIDNNHKTKNIVFTKNNCHCDILDGECRANRIHSGVDSSIFADSCELYKNDGTQYICTPYTISKDLTLIITIVTKTEAETSRVRDFMSDIEDYITTARPSIISKKLMQLLNRLARVDQLTGMYNRKFLDEFTDVSIPQAVRSGVSYSVLMIDIDFFKMINDTYGHDVGDDTIKIISRVIRDKIRQSDIAIRYGGEEFLVLLYNCDKENVRKISEDIRDEFSKQEITGNGEVFKKTLSIGFSSFPEDSNSIWKCIKYADLSLYRAKHTGRNKVVEFTQELLEKQDIGESF